ncbi:acetate--CoA ligase family protein [Streptomyces sp. CA-132043]|uniref:acetate--CoA ligase family protein n=1 Tax=Streptomyces sp. CA-132043 TaxID=3240048 RepID=UPI003D938CB9
MTPADRTGALDVLLHPRSIAVLGASDNPLKLSGRPVDLLKRYGFTGRVLPVNSRRDTVQGLKAYPALDAIDGDIDLAMITLDAAQAAGAVRDCARRGIRAAIVGAAGFAETGEAGAALQRDLAAAVRETGIRVLGPNCLGLLSLRDHAVPTFTSALDGDRELLAGPVAFLSQSGAFGTFIFSAAQQDGIGFSHYVNTGNELDVSVAELLDVLAGTDEARVLLAYLEGVSDGPRLLRAARRAHAAGKPLVAVKVGRSAAGARAAHSHTASLAGEDRVFDGAARQYGIVRVAGMEPLLDAAQVFAAGRRTKGRRLTTLSLSGGAGVLMADEAGTHGIEVAPWEPEWQREMAAAIPPFGSPRNPVDLTAALVSDPGILRSGLQVALRHPGTDMLAVLLGNADAHADRLTDTLAEAYRATDRPLVVVWTGGDGRARRRLRGLGIPCYTDPGRAAAALGRLADFSLRPPLPTRERPAGIDADAAREVIARARKQGRTRLDEAESARLIAAYGLRCAESVAVAGAEEAVTAAAGLGGGPVAVKLLSAEVAHKSELGGVRLGLTGADAVRAAAQDVLRAAARAGVPDARLLVQRMAAADGAAELLLGIKHDPAFGPVVVAGFGGVLVDVLDDSRVAVAPVDPPGARRLLRALRAAPVLDGVRGAAARDLDAAADAVHRLSWLATDLAGELAELDVNPLLLGAAGEGATAVDCLAVLTPRSGAAVPTDGKDHA